MRPTRKRPPIIDGLPSPSVAKMARMNIVELEAHIAKLTVESGHLEKRIERLEAMKTPNPDQIKPLKGQQARLATLISLAQQKLVEKRDRKDQWDTGQRPPRSGGSGPYNSRGGSSGYGSGGGSRPSGGYGGPSRGRPRW